MRDRGVEVFGPSPVDVDRVLLKIARGSGEFRSAVLSAADIPAAEQLRADGLAFGSMGDEWWNLTDAGKACAAEIARRS